MLVQCFTHTTNWNKFIEIKENLAIKIKEIVESEKAGFAFPSQSIYVESTPNNNEEILKK
jgi:MscS family membrane protein